MPAIPNFSDDPRPVFEQIADDLRERIKSGRLPVGAQLPSQAVLADEYGVAINTLRSALKELTAEGVISTQSTRGTFVMKEPGDPDPSPADLVKELHRITERLKGIEERLDEVEQRRD